MPSNKTAQAALAGNNLIIVLLLVTVVVIVGAGFAGKSLYDAITLNRKVLDAKSAADTKLATDLENAPKLVESYGQLGGLARVVGDALPVTRDIPSVLVTMENIGLQSGLTVKSITPVPTVASSVAGANAEQQPPAGVGVPLTQSFRVGIAFSGTYASLQKFLAAVELSARPMKVVNLQLSGGGNALAGQVDIQTYYQDKATLPIVTENIK